MSEVLSCLLPLAHLVHRASRGMGPWDGGCLSLAGGLCLSRTGKGVSLGLSCQETALMACPTHGDCLPGLHPDSASEPEPTGATAFPRGPDSTARTPWRSEAADTLSNKYASSSAPQPPLKQPPPSPRTRELSRPHTVCFQMTCVQQRLQAWVGRSWPQGTIVCQLRMYMVSTAQTPLNLGGPGASGGGSLPSSWFSCGGQGLSGSQCSLLSG